jgi:NAD(P)-dependent dehydrogenase (short-subunit alcohol dehydrogenase family)
MPKILVTGNPTKDIASALKTKYPNAVFVSRGIDSDLQMDLTFEANQRKLAELSVEYDVFINAALLRDFGQVRLLQQVWTEWKANNKSGHIISFGSAVDYFYRADNRLYAVEKRALRDLNRSLAKHCVWYDSKIKCTYLSFGGVATEKTARQWGHYNHFSIYEIANYVEWILSSPSQHNIDELHITPIQPETKSKMKEKEDKTVEHKWESGDERTYLISDD